MGKIGKKDAKTQRTKKPAVTGARVKDLPVKDASGVKGGQKAGGTKENFLVVTMSDVLISS